MREFSHLPLSQISEGPAPRREPDLLELDQLIQSIKQHGMLQPIRVRQEGDGFVCVVGLRRLQAATLAGLEKVPCLLIQGEPTEADLLEEQLTAQLCHAPLTDLEQARAFRALIDLRGWTQRELADHVCVNQATVSRALALLQTAPETQELVEAGELPASAALEIGRLPAEEQPAAARKVAQAKNKRQAAKDERDGGRPAWKDARQSFETPNGCKITLTATSERAAKKLASEKKALAELRAFLAEVDKPKFQIVEEEERKAA